MQASSDPTGVAFVDTASLDGETNLKKRQVSEAINKSGYNFSIPDQIKGLRGRVECAAPDAVCISQYVPVLFPHLFCL